MECDGNATFQYFGGDAMANVAPGCIKHTRELAIMGFWEVITHLGHIVRNLRFCMQSIQSFQPDVVILVDFPGFNFRVARQCHTLGIPVFYYIAPKVWAWRESRVRLIQRYVDRLFVIFPFETDFFQQRNVEAIYEGNPLLDQLVSMRPDNSDDQPAFNQMYGLDARPKIALLPGSRHQEIRLNLPPMAQLASQFPSYQFVIAQAPSIPDSFYQKYLPKNSAIPCVRGATYRLMMHAAAGIITSGTATLEAALLQLPEVVVYKANRISAAIARNFIKVPFISLVNIIMGKEVVKELIQRAYSPSALAEELKAILPGGKKRKAQLEHFAQLSNMLGTPGVAKRIAMRMFHILSER